MSDVWGTVYQLERDRATGNDPDNLRREHDDYVIRANANVCELNREIERLRLTLREIEEIADDRADVDDGIPNNWMLVLGIVRTALKVTP